MAEQLNGLRFDIYERVQLPEEAASIAELEEIELLPHMQTITQEDQIVLKGHLFLSGVYRSGESNESGERLEHRIPVEISLPPARVRRVEDLRVSIDHFDVDILSERSLNVTGVLALQGLETEPQEPPVWREDSFTVVHQAQPGEAWGFEREARKEEPPWPSDEPLSAPGASAGLAEAGPREAERPGEAYTDVLRAETKAFGGGESLASEENFGGDDSVRGAESGYGGYFGASPFFRQEGPEPGPAAGTEPAAFLRQDENQGERNDLSEAMAGARADSGDAACRQDASDPASRQEASPAEEVISSGPERAANPAFSSGAAAVQARASAAEAGSSQAFPFASDAVSARACSPASDAPSSLGFTAASDAAASPDLDAAPTRSAEDQAGLAEENRDREPQAAVAGKGPDAASAATGASLLSALAEKSEARQAELRVSGSAKAAAEADSQGAPSAGAGEEVEWTKLFLGKNAGEEQFRKVRMYIVQRDDTLESVAARYNVQVRDLQIRNKLSDNYLTEGQILYIP
mgnify:CR=1 FL=1